MEADRRDKAEGTEDLLQRTQAAAPKPLPAEPPGWPDMRFYHCRGT